MAQLVRSKVNPTTPFSASPPPAPAPSAWSASVDSWYHPGALLADGEPDLTDPAWQSASFLSHDAAEPPNLVGNTGCAEVPFEPSITVQPTTDRADSPTGLNVDLTMPQSALTEPAALNQADVKDTVVTQPLGTRVNPAAADGLTGCTEAQVDLSSSLPPTCPDSSKIGTVEIESPLVPDTLEGGIFQARQGENPFGSTLAFYAVASADGVMIKLPAQIKTDPATGQVTTIFRDNPQLPFEHYKLHFKSGPRAPLITPPTCGTKTTHSTFTGWANPDQPVETTDSFKITEGANGTPCPNSEAERPFHPSFEAGTTNPLAGVFSPFVLKIGREDGMQELSGLETTLPPGLIGKLAGIPYCPEAAIAAAKTARGLAERSSPSCPAASLLGTTDATAGAGPTPFHNPGRVYLAGPYKGAPLSVVDRHSRRGGPVRPRRRPRPRRPLRRPRNDPDPRRLRPDPEHPRGRGRQLPARRPPGHGADEPPGFHPQPDQLRPDERRRPGQRRAGRLGRGLRPLPGRRLRRARFQTHPEALS